MAKKKTRFHLYQLDTQTIDVKKYTDVDKAFDACKEMETKTNLIWIVIAEIEGTNGWAVFPEERKYYRTLN
ncbi:hypothetical protein D3C76_1855320 [compost metagenome]